MVTIDRDGGKLYHMSTSEKLSERIQVVVAPSERAKLEALAVKQERSLSYVARSLILKGLGK